MGIKGKHPGIAYATKGNILFPGTQTQADALERRAEDELETYFGLGSTVLANTLAITIAN